MERCSALLPLHKGLVIATDGVEVAVARSEHNTDNVLGVATVRTGPALDARVTEEADEAVVVTGGKEGPATGGAH